MGISRCAYSIAAIVLAFLLILSAFMVRSNPTSGIVEASNASTNVNAASDGGDLLQYEWPQIHGNPAFTRFSEGPAPEAPDILWKTTVKNVQSFVAAFNGKVFVTTTTNVVALNKDNGSVVWNTTLPASERWAAVYKIDNTHLVVGNYCLDVETGEVLWAGDELSTSNYFAPGVYSPEEKIFCSKGKSSVKAWNFSDPSKPPTLAWEAYVPGGGTAGSGVHYGDGKVFPGSYDAHQMALDAKTGETLWDTLTTGAMMFSGSYYEGRFLRGGVDNQFYSFNATTGEVLWVFNPGTEFGHWSSGCAAAYGKVYQANKDGHLYAIDVNKGHLAWKYKGPGFLFFPGWPVIADGKVYATTGQAASRDPYTGEAGESEFVCLDAYTGRLLWRLPIEAHAPRESTAIAYGNLYLVPGSIEEDEMDRYTTLDEVWAIGTKPWPMWRHDPEHSGAGQSGPKNLTLRWKFTTGGAVISSPSVVDRKVYVGSSDKNIYCLDALSGGLLWNFTTGFGIKSSPAVVDGKVYVGPDDGYVYCLDAENGSLVWKEDAGGYIPAHFDAVARLRSSPAVVGGRVYVGSLDTNLYCLNASSGDVIWAYKTEGYITSSPAVVEDAVYIVSQEPTSGALYKLDADTGTRIWKLGIPYELSGEGGTDMHASPTVADNMVFTSSNKLERYRVNSTTGNIEWTYRNMAYEFIVDSMSHHDGKLFFVDLLFVVCVDAKNTSSIWKTYLGEVLESSPTYGDGKIYVAGSDKRAIYVLNSTDGDRLSWFRTGSKCWSSPTLYEGRMYIGNHDWNVYCFVDAGFPIISTSIVANLSKNTVNRTKGEYLTVTGQLEPRITNTPVTVTFVKPDGTTVDLPVTTNERGTFTASYTPNTVGNWTVTAWYGGMEYPSRAYTNTCSADLPLEVVATMEQPPPPPSAGIPTEYIYAIIFAIAIAIAALSGYSYLKKGKK